ncbi:MAG: C4-type zinc ribbon domain-containing protein [Armatimonadota bacterium]
MKMNLYALYDLQEVDSELEKAKKELTELCGADELKEKLSGAKAKLSKVDSVFKKHHAILKDGELKKKSLEEKRKKYEDKLFGGTVTSAKELTALEKEVQNLKIQEKELSDSIRNLKEQVDAAKHSYERGTEIIANLEAKIKNIVDDEKAKRTSLEKQIAKLQTKREKMAAKIKDAQLISRYERIRSKKENNGIGIAKVIQCQCDACKVAVTPYIISLLEKGDSIETCENCGRILMLG